MNSSSNPFNVTLQDVIIRKFIGTDKMSVMPQVAEFVLYQSIFSSMLKADIVFNDTIGLMNNYPLSGEETIEVTIKQGSEETAGDGQKEFTKTITFVISAINNILVSDDGRTMSYAMELASYDAFTNAKTRVSHAYNENIETMIEEIYKNYIVKGRSLPKPKKLKIFKDTEKVRKLVIPNIKPFDAIAWLCKFAISKEPEKYYTHMFFETLENYTFKTMQKLTFRDLEDAAALVAASKEKYIYVSNIELVKNNPKAMDALRERGFSEDRIISDFKINKRYSALEKIVGGYFENELVEVNMLKNDYKITRKELKYKDYEFNTINPGKGYNTAEYIENVKKEYEEPETSARIRYIINNYDDENQPSFRDKFGRSAMSFLAFQQVDISMAINSNLLVRPGDLIFIELPEFHGFNFNDQDQYLTGFYIVSEIKTVIRQGGKSGMQVRINRDSFIQDLALKHKYLFDNGDPQISPSNPMGPR
jgi:hypothetical protein